MRKGEDREHTYLDVPSLCLKNARRRKRIDITEIADYLAIVDSGKHPVNIEIKLLSKYVRNVFATEELWFDYYRMRKYRTYADRYFMELDPEELFMTALWLCTYTKGGMPRWPDLWLYVGRGYGKTSLMAFWGFCLISPANGIPEYDYDVCATTEPQARISFDELHGKFERDPDLWSQGYVWNKEEIHCRETWGRYKYWTGNSSSKDGMKSGCVAFDEKHAYTDNGKVEVFEGGLGKKPDPRTLTCTTDGDVRDGPLDEDKERAEAILRRQKPDHGFLPVLHRLDDIKELDDKRKWPKANPRLLYSDVLMWEYERDFNKYLVNPDMHTAVPTKRFNMPTQPVSAAVANWEDLTACMRGIGDVSGMPCVIGIDFAMSTDMVGACALFRDDDEWKALTHGWFTSKSNDVNNIKAPLGKWASEGWLTITDDVETSPYTVAEWVSAIAIDHDVRRIGLDRYRYGLMQKALKDAGFDDYDKSRGTGQIRMVRPADQWQIQPVVASALKKREIAWGETNSIARWCANNVKLVPKPNENWGYGKQEPHGRKTDVFMAMIHAWCVSDALDDPEVAPIEMMQPIVIGA